MSDWKYKVDIKQHLTDDESVEGIVKASNAIAKELQKLPDELFEDFTFEDDVEFLYWVSKDDMEVYESEEDLLKEVNHRLNSIYDFANCNKIWLGV